MFKPRKLEILLSVRVAVRSITVITDFPAVHNFLIIFFWLLFLHIIFPNLLETSLQIYFLYMYLH